MRGLTIVVALLFFVSCNTFNYKTPETKVSDLELILDDCTSSFNEIDTIWAQKKYDESISNIKLVEFKDIADSSSIINEYKKLSNSLKEFNSLRAVLNVDLEFCKLQVSNLKSDMANGFLDKDEFERNFAIEKKSVDIICKKIEIYKSGAKKMKEKYNIINPRIKSLMN
ncbi:MAG: hypothetical protein C0598_12635 [Marinilabiliales bacterium]|nr:MAG: hypothetical protein C0598_12635 [Marinilabiliales bacterium]